MLDSSTITNLAVIMTTIFLSTAVHEVVHALVALKLGDDLAYHKGRITLNPLKHIDPFLTIVLPLIMLLLGSAPIMAAKPVPININRVSGREMGMALIAVAGPLSNLVMAIVVGLMLRVNNFDGFLFDFLATFFTINVGLFVFNMIPFPPLDGSRLMYAFAPEPIQKVMDQIESVGIAGIIIFISLLYPVIGPAISSIRITLERLIIG